MVKTADLLSLPTNYAVVQLPERRFPGVVVQGDTLNELVKDLGRMSQLLESGRLDDLAAEIQCMKGQLLQALVHYEHICTDQRLELPYTRD